MIFRHLFFNVPTLLKKKSLLLAFLFLLGTGCAQKIYMEEPKTLFQNNKTIPANIEKEAKIALSHFPELKDIAIEFKFKNNIQKSFMQAQPTFKSLFSGKKNREYFVFISSSVNIEGHEFSVEEVPSAVLIGWLGHELGHIMDYKGKSAFGLIVFGFKYITSKKYIQEAERMADTYAVNHGMGEYILKTKNYILDHSHLSEVYKNRIKRLYLSPEEIVVLVNELENETEKKMEEVEKEES